MQPTIEIRPYRDEDLERMLEVWAAASALAHPFLTPEFLATERRNLATSYPNSAELWVCEVDGEVVEILVANGQPVEYGEVLFRLKPL